MKKNSTMPQPGRCSGWTFADEKKCWAYLPEEARIFSPVMRKVPT
jgi:hypothetical protein